MESIASGSEKPKNIELPQEVMRDLVERKKLRDHFVAMAQGLCEPVEIIEIVSSKAMQEMSDMDMQEKTAFECIDGPNNPFLPQNRNIFGNVEDIVDDDIASCIGDRSRAPSLRNETCSTPVFTGMGMVMQAENENSLDSISENIDNGIVSDVADRSTTPTFRMELCGTPEFSQMEMLTEMCELCDMKCATRRALVNHIHKAHPASKLSNDFGCFFCGRKMLTAKSLRKHELVCVDSMVKCSECIDCLVHLYGDLNVHLAENNFVCINCLQLQKNGGQAMLTFCRRQSGQSCLI